jgi:deoxyribodipyrimidine photolyase-related protein
MSTIRIVLSDQLSHTLSALTDIDAKTDIILLPELDAWATKVPHHKKKLVLWFSAMRHFAQELRDLGYRVIHLPIEGDHGVCSLTEAITYALQHGDAVMITAPSEYDLRQEVDALLDTLPITIREDDRFMASPAYFAEWAQQKKSVLMEYFYRSLRIRYGILVEGNKPIGGKWNFDASNRKPLPDTVVIPPPTQIAPDSITQAVIEMVNQRFPEHMGDGTGFHYAVTADQAMQVLRHFIQARLPWFGDYQDAMVDEDVWLFHSHISFYLNIGLLLPATCIEAAETAYHEGKVPLNAAEGFIRQILGWREFVRGLYWHKMPSYKQANYLEAKRALPQFYWDAKTDMHCIKRAVESTITHAYAHHIQRLMVLGNFALLIGVHPQALNHWFWVVYADAYEWVELPNVSGMVLYADGGYLASKPYAAGGSYIHKMSNYCQHCVYNVREKNGKTACPFNYLYWDFMSRNRDKIGKNPRIAMMLKTYDKMPEAKKQAIANDSVYFLEQVIWDSSAVL